MTSVIVGSEVLLRGEMTVNDLREIIRSVKARIDTPITYADSWDYWLRYKEMAADVDFVTIHMLPFWEDEPIRAEDAAAHVIDIYKKVALAFPGKSILIGEAGWPSKGRMREVSLPSRINQGIFISELLDRASREKIRVNVFEAYDEPWKRNGKAPSARIGACSMAFRVSSSTRRDQRSAIIRSGSFRWESASLSLLPYSWWRC